MTPKSVNRGKQLKFCRGFRGYSQSELCKKIKGLKHGNLSKFEFGFENMIDDEKLKEIMDFLKFPFEWLDVQNPRHKFVEDC